jgi:hypothetical protein
MSRLSQLFSRRPPSSAVEEPEIPQATIEHFTQFTRSRVGVEAYIEPETHDTGTTLMLIATTGEWTRRRIPDVTSARKTATNLGLPVYEVRFTGYPQRMREWNTKQRHTS